MSDGPTGFRYRADEPRPTPQGWTTNPPRYEVYDASLQPPRLLSKIPITHENVLVAVSPLGHVAAFSDQKGIMVWDVLAGRSRLQIPSEKPAKKPLAINANGNRLAVVEKTPRDSVIKIWDTEIPADKPLVAWSLFAKSDHFVGATVHQCLFTKNGQQLVVYASRPINPCFWVRVYDVTTARLITEWSLPDAAKHLAVSDDGSAIATIAFAKGPIRDGSANNTVTIHNLTTGAATHDLRGHTSAVTAIAFSTNGKRLATAGADNTMRIWNTDTGQEMLSQPTTGTILQLQFCASGSILCGLEKDGYASYSRSPEYKLVS